MDKRRLNNEIVLCRPAVRKARVAVIRKLLKKIKILRACKLEVVKEKKFKKSERLFEKVQIIKKIKNDEITKFALCTKDLDDFLKGSKISLRQNALTCLAKHEAVMKKITSIKEQIPNWEVELPLLLDSLGKKKNNTKRNLKEFKSNNSILNKSKGNEMQKKTKASKDNLGKISSEKGKIKVTKGIPKKFTVLKDDDKKPNKKQDESQSCLSDITYENPSKIEKIDDPFFIQKKVVPSKLLSEDLSSEKNFYEVKKLENFKIKEIKNSHFLKKSYKSDKNSNKSKMQKLLTDPEKEELHPSWAAKKVKLIKPFQGIKIKFSDD